MEFGLEKEKDSVLHVYSLSESDANGDDDDNESLQGDDKLLWERRNFTGRDDYNHAGEIVVEYNYEEERERVWKRRFGAYWAFMMKQISTQEFQNDLMEGYCNMGSMLHFVFRQSVAIRHCNSGADSGGKFCQLFGPSLRLNEGNSNSTIRKIWRNYQELSLKLRLGSKSIESTLDSYDEITADVTTEQDTISQFRPSTLLNESGLTTDEKFFSFVDGDHVYAAIAGKDYEFYAVLPANLSSPSDSQILCSTLVETLMSKGEMLQPISFL